MSNCYRPASLLTVVFAALFALSPLATLDEARIGGGHERSNRVSFDPVQPRAPQRHSTQHGIWLGGKAPSKLCKRDAVQLAIASPPTALVILKNEIAPRIAPAERLRMSLFAAARPARAPPPPDEAC